NFTARQAKSPARQLAPNAPPLLWRGLLTMPLEPTAGLLVTSWPGRPRHGLFDGRLHYHDTPEKQIRPVSPLSCLNLPPARRCFRRNFSLSLSGWSSSAARFFAAG